MKRVKGYRLFVELNASQVRRRLRGHGFGVRKVESAGSNRAVIIHTATGDHLRELEGLFRDVAAVIIDELKSEAEEGPTTSGA
ncbi:MAG: hypothetical protein WD229_02420 [Pirellulales bacterium]